MAGVEATEIAHEAMSREIQVVWVGRRESAAWEELCGVYRGRIGLHTPISERFVRTSMVKDPRLRLRKERQALEATIPDPAWVVALDRRGRQFSSLEFASYMEELRDGWPHPVVFALGSDLGLEKGFLSEARERLSFGKMTLAHNLARLVLYEQIYRALSIGAGIKYHREPL